MSRAILLHPDKRLRRRAREVPGFDAALRDRLAELVEAMLERDLGGLSAVQIGSPWRLVALNLDDGRAMTLINPKIVWASKEIVATAERCPSLPRRVFRLERAARVKVLHLRQSGPEVLSVLESPEVAVALQHELDHLNGVLPLDREQNRMMREVIDRSGERPRTAAY